MELTLEIILAREDENKDYNKSMNYSNKHLTKNPIVFKEDTLFTKTL
jgi:hypothetical protein